MCLQCGRPGFNPWVGKIPWRRAWQPTPVFLPGESSWTEEPVELQSMGSQRVWYNWEIKHMVYKWQHWDIRCSDTQSRFNYKRKNVELLFWKCFQGKQMFANKINVPAWVLCLLRQAGSLSRKKSLWEEVFSKPAKRYASLGSMLSQEMLRKLERLPGACRVHPNCVSIMAGLLSPTSSKPTSPPQPICTILQGLYCV